MSTESIVSCLKTRVKLQHPDLLTDTLTVLATQGSEDANFANAAIHSLSSQFEVPLRKARVDLALHEEEWGDMIEYARRYLNLVQEDYHTIWWKLFNVVDSKKWTNILSLVELLFCLPMANGRVERLFSSLKLIKTNRRCCLSENHLDHLVCITVDAPSLAQWDASTAGKLWWKDKKRRQVASTSTPQDDSSSNTESYTFSLDDWESFIA